MKELEGGVGRYRYSPTLSILGPHQGGASSPQCPRAAHAAVDVTLLGILLGGHPINEGINDL